MCWVEIVFLASQALILAVVTIALLFTLEPLAYVVATLCGLGVAGIIKLIEKIHSTIERGY